MHKIYVILIFLISVLVFCGAASAAPYWKNETVNDTYDGIWYDQTSLALDTSGNPKIAYNSKESMLNYAYKDSSGWHSEKVDVSCYSPSLKLNSSNDPRMSYVDWNLLSIKYAYRIGPNNWQIETIDQGNVFALYYDSMVLDANGVPHISYEIYDSSNNWVLKYAYRTGLNTWQKETVDNTPGAGDYNSIAIYNGKPMISYYLQNSLIYAYRTGTNTWQKEIVDSDGNVGQYSSIAVDSSGNPKISYYDANNKNLKYAYRTGTNTWQNEIVDSEGDVGQYISLKLFQNNPRISYYDVTNGNLKYASKNGSNSWVTTNADTNPNNIGFWTSLALDNYGNPKIIYCDDTDKKIKYAYLNDGNSPKVSSSDPANNAVHVARNKVIKVNFNEPIKAGNMWIELYNAIGTKKLTTITPSISGNVLTINHAALLATGTKYTLALHTGSISDMTGNNLAGVARYFTTSTDGTVPTITNTDPVNNAVNVARNKAISVTFNEAIKAGTMWIELYNTVGTKKLIPITTSISGNVLTINHAALLATGTKYTLALHTGSITDLAGNSLAGVARYFTTSTDATAPTITTTDPVNNAVNVARNKVITVTFSEPVKAGNMWLELYNAIGTKTLIPITTSISGNVLTINHAALLATGTKYTIALHTGSVTDTAGNPVASAVRYFTTANT